MWWGQQWCSMRKLIRCQWATGSGRVYFDCLCLTLWGHVHTLIRKITENIEKKLWRGEKKKGKYQPERVGKLSRTIKRFSSLTPWRQMTPRVQMEPTHCPLKVWIWFKLSLCCMISQLRLIPKMSQGKIKKWVGTSLDFLVECKTKLSVSPSHTLHSQLLYIQPALFPCLSANAKWRGNNVRNVFYYK